MLQLASNTRDTNYTKQKITSNHSHKIKYVRRKRSKKQTNFSKQYLNPLIILKRVKMQYNQLNFNIFVSDDDSLAMFFYVQNKRMIMNLNFLLLKFEDKHLKLY